MRVEIAGVALGISLASLSCSSGTPAGTGGTGAGGGSSTGGSGGSSTGPAANLQLGNRELTLSVDDAGSLGGDAPIASYTWDFGDGARATGRTPAVHTYARTGN